MKWRTISEIMKSLGKFQKDRFGEDTYGMVMKEKIERNSSIELLRILLGFAVIILHFNFYPGGGAVELTAGLTKTFLVFLEIICICAVNTFILISGYYGVKTAKINFSRLFKLIIQTIAFQFAFAFVSCLTSGTFSIVKLCRALLPVNYYVILYSSLMFMAPYINRLMNSLKEKNLRIFLFISFLLFSVYPTIVEVFEEAMGVTLNGLNSIGLSGSDAGYTIVNFILVYMIGAFLQITNEKEKQNVKKLTLSLLGCIFVLFVWRAIMPNTAFIYCNPFIIIEGVCIFLFFAKLHLNSKIVNVLAPASFTCFLINIQFLGFIGFDWLTGKSFLEVIGIMSVEVIAIFLIAFIAMNIWNFVTKPIFYRTVDKISEYRLEE